MQKVKFILGFSDFGGSTIAIINQANLLSTEFDVEIYGDGSFLHENHEKSKNMQELKTQPEDILIYHYIEQEYRPNCKKCFLYVHEKSIFELKNKQIKGYDDFIFVHENQRMYHGFNGQIIPNRIKNLVDVKNYNPPNQNIAGIVGAIEYRKNTHVSICKALENNCQKVLLFGKFENSYFKDIVEPMLSERIIYKGLFSNKMRMYNQFDDLYHFSNEESACLSVGESKVLGKRIFKSKYVDDFEILEDHEILEKWKSLFQS